MLYKIQSFWGALSGQRRKIMISQSSYTKICAIPGLCNASTIHWLQNPLLMIRGIEKLKELYHVSLQQRIHSFILHKFKKRRWKAGKVISQLQKNKWINGQLSDDVMWSIVSIYLSSFHHLYYIRTKKKFQNQVLQDSRGAYL